MVTWEAIGLAALSLSVGTAGWFLKELAAEVKRLSICVSKQGEWRSQHDVRHIEMREDRMKNEDDLWAAVNDLRKERK